MDLETLHDSTVSIVDGDIGESTNTNDFAQVNSSNGDVTRERRFANELLSRVEMDLACSSEKMVNLNILMMHVSAKESDLEAFDLRKEDELVDSAEKVLEFDYLSAIFQSELGEVGAFMTSLQSEILSARQMTSSLGEASIGIEGKLFCSEETLKQSEEQISYMRKQSTKFRRALSNFSGEEKLYENEALHASEDAEILPTNAKIQMQTSQQQRHVLRMLEQSLATELDLEQKLTELRQAQDELKSRLLCSEREVLSLEKQTSSLLQRLFEAENEAEVLKGVSLDLVGQLQSCHFSLKCALEREVELNGKLEINSEVKSQNNREIADLKDRIATVEGRAESAEANCKLVEEANMKLNEDLEILRREKVVITAKVQQLERQLREANIQLQEAEASVEASEERQSLLEMSIRDMETVIADLKAKNKKAEKRADDAEDKWIMLSESNMKLTDDVRFLRGRVECLEASLNQEEESKAALVKDVNVRTKVITDLVMQLAIERESLHKQVCSLIMENRFYKDQSTVTGFKAGKFDVETESKNCKTSLVTNEKPPEGDISSDPIDVGSKLESVHTIDASRLGLKQTLVAILVGVIAVMAVCAFHPESCPLRGFL